MQAINHCLSGFGYFIISSHLHPSLIHTVCSCFRDEDMFPQFYLLRLVMMNALLLYSCFVVLGLEINKILPVEYIRGIGLPRL